MGGSKSCVAVLCRIGSYSVTSSSPRSKCCITVPRFSLLGSQLCVHGYFSTVKCLSFTNSLNSVPSTTSLSLRSLAPLFRSLCSMSSSVSFLGRLQSSVTSCSCAGLRALLLVELLWVSMGNKTCSLKR